MTTNVTMPQMGESIFEGTITKWLKKEGDTVVRDEALFEISTDKVDSEIPSPASGILAKILVPEGKTIQINTVLAIIDEAAAQAKGDAGTLTKQEAVEEAPEDRKAAPPEEPPAAASRRMEPAVPAAAMVKPAAAVEPDSGVRAQDIRTSPLVRRLARENNIDLALIRGTGIEGRITRDDVLRYLEQRSRGGASPDAVRADERTSGTAAAEPAPKREAREAAPAETPQFAGESETVPMSVMRKAIAEHMVLSKRTSAHVNTVFEVDMTAIVQLRDAHKADFQKREGVPLTFTPFLAKALVDTVREFPVFNSSVSGDSIVYKKPIHLGVAVALDAGLIVPVVKDAHLKSLTGLALAIYDLAERARTKRLKPEDVQNGTISMTNPGSYGALFATPIISQPQVAILGIGGIEKRPVVINDAIAIRSMACLSLTFDHRVIDGAVADRFMAKLKLRLQSWTQWME